MTINKEPYQFRILKVGQKIQKDDLLNDTIMVNNFQGRLSVVKGESDIPKPKAVGTPM